MAASATGRTSRRACTAPISSATCSAARIWCTASSVTSSARGAASLSSCAMDRPAFRYRRFRKTAIRARKLSASASGAKSASARKFSRISTFRRSGCSPRPSTVMSVSQASVSRSWPPSRFRNSALLRVSREPRNVDPSDHLIVINAPAPLSRVCRPCHHGCAGATEKRMRTWMTGGLALVGALTLAVWAYGGAASNLRFADMPRKAADTNVDVELVLAVDISYSMEPDEQALQREGYITALTSREFLEALRHGMHGKIAVTYFEWAGASDQRIVVPWRLIDGPAAAKTFTDAIAAAPYRRAYRTSISGALHFALPLFEDSGFRGLRRVIDVSGDGVNNQGDLVTIVRDAVLERGITINGLPILLKRPSPATMDIEDLDIYYEDCVIGGPGAFVIPIRERDQFREAARTKLVQEIASREVAPRVIPVAAKKPRISCTIGEKMWQQRWGGMDFR